MIKLKNIYLNMYVCIYTYLIFHKSSRIKLCKKIRCQKKANRHFFSCRVFWSTWLNMFRWIYPGRPFAKKKARPSSHVRYNHKCISRSLVHDTWKISGISIIGYKRDFWSWNFWIRGRNKILCYCLCCVFEIFDNNINQIFEQGREQ